MLIKLLRSVAATAAVAANVGTVSVFMTYYCTVHSNLIFFKVSSKVNSFCVCVRVIESPKTAKTTAIAYKI